MKIFYSHHVFCQQRYGGISRYFTELMRRISSNHEVIVNSPIYINDYLKALSESVKVNGYYLNSQRPIRGQTKVFSTINDLLLASARRPEISHKDIVHDTFYPINKWDKRGKRILTVFDMISEKMKDKFPKQMGKGSENLKLKEMAIRNAAHIICISTSTKNDLQEILDIPEARISVTNLAANYIEPQSVENIFTNKPYLLYVGYREGYKNFNALLNIYAKSNIRKSFDLVVAGWHSPSIEERSVINTFALDRNVIFTQCTNSELGFLYQNATALIYPSLYEGFGLPILEAMQYGCPVICSNTSSMPEVAGDAAEYFEPSNPDSIIYAIENTIFDSEKLQSLSNRGHERAKYFSWEKCAQETIEIYRDK